MNKRITFRHMEHSNHLESHAEQQLEKIMKLLETEKTPILVDLILEAHKLRGHNKVDFHVKTPNLDFFVSDEASDMEQLVSSVIDKMYLKLREDKKKRLKKRTE